MENLCKLKELYCCFPRENAIKPLDVVSVSCLHMAFNQTACFKNRFIFPTLGAKWNSSHTSLSTVFCIINQTGYLEI